MNGYVLRLDEIRAADVELAGGKGANLADLAASRFPIPPAFVVPARAARELFERLDLVKELASLDGAMLAEVARRVQQRIVDAQLDASLETAILDAHARLVGAGPDTACVVRSSATAEDLEGASFAGQHGTYYDVDRSQLVEMIKRCWASLWNPEAVRYRAARGIPHLSVSMAVVVQEMIRSDVSGVAFTANPLNGDRREIIVESSWGMGAAIVDGRVTPDRFVVARDTLRVVDRRIAIKRLMVLPSRGDGPAERLTPVPVERQRRETLNAGEAAAVAEWSLECERHFGAPQDVEWAFSGGRFFILQSRPITTLSPGAGEEAVPGQFVLFKAVAENFTEPLTPLTEDLMSAGAPPQIRMIGGRPYFDLQSVRRLLPFDSSDRAMAEFVYLRAAPSPVTWSFRRLPALLLGAVVWYLVLAVLLARTRGMPDDFMHSYRSLCRRIDEDATFGPRESLERLWLRPGLFEPVGDMALLVNATFFRLVPWMAALEAMLRRWVAQMPADAAALLSSGTAGILSAEMGREIELLAREARRSPAVARLFAVSSQPEELLPRLRKEPAAQPFLAGLERFLAVHGHRAAKEFELRSPRWAEDPAPVVAMIRNYVAAPAEPAVDRDKAAHARTELEAVIRNALAGRPFERRFRVRWRLIRAAAGKVRYYLKLRENSRFYHIMALGIVRRKILQIEEELLRDRKLKCRDDIFFLRMREIEALRAGPSEGAALDARIRTRRLKHVKLSKAPAPMTIGIAPPEVSAETAGNRLHGQGASPGRHVGRARVIMDPAVEATLEPGEVLVAPYTDPAWTPLFLTAGAAVVEVGSYLSHAGTVAREYAMPCVVDVADCTRLIRTGMRVEVDADRGIVSILDGGST